MLSSAGLFAQPMGTFADEVMWWVAPEDRTLLRELFLTHSGSPETLVAVWIETPEEVVASYVFFGLVPASGLVRSADLFVVLEPNWKLHALSTEAGCFIYGAGHHWPGAGSAVGN